MSQRPVWCSTQTYNKDSSVAQRVESPSPCYFMVADILGFSRMIENLNGNQQAQRIAEWVDLVQRAGLQAGVEERRLISDTLFARAEDSPDGLARLLKFSQLLLENGVDKSFPLRGAIVQGNAAWGELPYGEAVIEAHRMEVSLDWLGIACEPGLLHLASLWDWDLVTVYPVPRKAAETRLMPAVSWKVPSTNALVRKVSDYGLMAEGDIYKWDVVSKLERTIQFGIYLKIGKAKGLDPQRYNFLFPMQMIEQVLKPLD